MHYERGVIDAVAVVCSLCTHLSAAALMISEHTSSHRNTLQYNCSTRMRMMHPECIYDMHVHRRRWVMLACLYKRNSRLSEKRLVITAADDVMVRTCSVPNLPARVSLIMWYRVIFWPRSPKCLRFHFYLLYNIFSSYYKTYVLYTFSFSRRLEGVLCGCKSFVFFRRKHHIFYASLNFFFNFSCNSIEIWNLNCTCNSCYLESEAINDYMLLRMFSITLK